jgi:hypothetical protein
MAPGSKGKALLLTYKSLTCKSVTYKSATYKSLTYKSTTYKSSDLLATTDFAFSTNSASGIDP